MLYILNFKVSIQKNNDIPPLGKLLDPFHGFWQNAEKDPLNIKVIHKMADLNNKVDVIYEDNLIPHIFSGNEHDLYFIQGYLTAYHRLWQMEFLTFIASGRVSEKFGKRALSFDRLQRRKGLMYGAENSLKALEQEQQQFNAIKAYSDGINAYIDQLEYKDYPVEYKLLDYSPEHWAPIKSVLLLKYMADDLSGSDYDLQNTDAYKLLGRKRFDFLFPDIPEKIDPIIPPDIKWNFDPVPINTPDSFRISTHFMPYQPVDKEEGKGSNNWAVSGSKTRSGYPILCNDPHLHFSMPSIWFVQQLKGPDINVYGVTIPGLPGVLLGFNDSLAWGLTNAPRDVRDWYQITFKDKEREDYLYDGKWLKTHKRIEKIKIRGEEAFLDTVIYTHYGPVVYDGTFMGDSTLENFSLKWTAHNPSLELVTIYKLNRADNLDQIKDAFKYFVCPPQNVAIATRKGDIGMFVEGKFPLKWKEQGKFLMNGSNPKYEWQGYIPIDQNASMLDPERGFVSSSNQHPFTADYPYYYYNNTEEFWRNRRINSELLSMSKITIDDMKKLQNDTYNLLAAEALPVMIDSLPETELTEVQKKDLQILKDWDYYDGANQLAPSYFEAWWEKLRNLLWDEFDNDMALVKPDEHTTIKLLREYPDDPAYDILSTPEKETINDIMKLSFIKAEDSINHWKDDHNGEEPLWYKFKNTRLMHITGLKPFSILQVQTGGYEHIINANAPTWGASWRLIVELGDNIKAYGIYPGGQSGNPGSPAYDTFVDQWASGKYFNINFWHMPEEAADSLKSIKFSSNK